MYVLLSSESTFSGVSYPFPSRLYACMYPDLVI